VVLLLFFVGGGVFFLSVLFAFLFSLFVLFLIFRYFCALLMGNSQIMGFIFNILQILFLSLRWRNPLRTGKMLQTLHIPLNASSS